MYDLLKKIFVVFVVLGVVVSVFGVLYLEGQVIGLKQQLALNTSSEPTFEPIPTALITPAPTSSASFTLSSPKPTVTSTPQVTAPPKSYVSYIPLGGTFSTMNTNWVDVPNDQVTFDLVKDYSSSAKASWETFLRVDNANGEAHARLYDTTHGIAVDGSEITVTNTSTFTNTGSGNLSLWQGRNTYRVQMKSLNGSTVFLDSARIRISF